MNRFVKLSLVIAVLSGLSFGGVMSARAADVIDTTYVSSDAALVFVLRPKQMAENDKSRNLFRDAFMEEIQSEMGFGVTEIEQMVIQMTGGSGEEDAPDRFSPEQNAMIVFRFTRNFDIADFRDLPISRHKEKKRGRETYYSPNSRHQPAVWMPNKRTLVLGSERLVVKAIDEPSSMGLMVSRLRALDRSADFHFEMDGIRAQPLLAEVFRHAPKAGPFALVHLYDKVKRISASCDLDSDVPIDVLVIGNDEADAQQVQTAADELLLLAKTVWPANKVSVEKNVPDKEFAKSVIRTFDTALEKTKVEREGKSIHLQIKNKGGMVELPAVVAGALFGVRIAAKAAAEEDVRELEIERAKDAETRARMEAKRAADAAARAKERARRAEEEAARAPLKALQRPEQKPPEK